MKIDSKFQKNVSKIENKNLFERLNKLDELIDEWNKTNNSQLIISNFKIIRSFIEDFCTEFLIKMKKNIILNKNEVLLLQGIEIIVLSIVPSYGLLNKGVSNGFSNVELIIISHILYSDNQNNALFLKVGKIFEKFNEYTKYHGRLSNMLLYLIPVSVFFYKVSEKKLNWTKDSIYKKIDEYLIQIEKKIEESNNINFGIYIFNILLMTSNCSQISLLNFIKNSKKIHLLGKYKSKENSYLYRVFQNIFINEYQNSKKSKKSFFHYTNLRHLDQILDTRRIKFSKLTKMNDADEGILFKEKNDIMKFAFSFSTTFDGDSYALFNSYTELKGVAIEFDHDYFFQSFQYLKFSPDENTESVSYNGLEVSPIYYFESKEAANKIIEKWEKNIKNTFKEIVSNEYIKESIDKSRKYIAIMCKTSPWKYEKEMRVAFILNRDPKNIEILNGEYKEDSIFIKIPLGDKNLIKKIVLGPKIKNNKFEKENFENILKKHNLKHISIKETKINLNEEITK